jgi:hypothetical protein
MAQEPEIIRQNIEETRSELTRKIGALEQEVVGTVENVKDKVETTVENVKDTIQSTLESVKETFDVRLQTQRHPWAMVGGCVFAGYVVGSALPSTRRSATRTASTPAQAAASLSEWGQSEGGWPAEPRRRSFLSGLVAQFGPEIQKLKGMAVGAVGTVIQEMIKDRIPAGLAPHVQNVINDVTHKLGGAEIKGPVLPQSEERDPYFAHYEGMVPHH